MSTCTSGKSMDRSQSMTTSYGVVRGGVVQVYCEMGLNGGGYTFINPRDWTTLTNEEIEEMFTDRTNFLLRAQTNHSTQPYAVLKQLADNA